MLFVRIDQATRERFIESLRPAIRSFYNQPELSERWKSYLERRNEESIDRQLSKVFFSESAKNEEMEEIENWVKYREEKRRELRLIRDEHNAKPPEVIWEGNIEGKRILGEELVEEKFGLFTQEELENLGVDLDDFTVEDIGKIYRAIGIGTEIGPIDPPDNFFSKGDGRPIFPDYLQEVMKMENIFGELGFEISGGRRTLFIRDLRSLSQTYKTKDFIEIIRRSVRTSYYMRY